MNPDCGVLEELQPIDINLQYDFNYQQATILPAEVTVMPVGFTAKRLYTYMLPSHCQCTLFNTG